MDRTYCESKQLDPCNRARYQIICKRINFRLRDAGYVTLQFFLDHTRRPSHSIEPLTPEVFRGQENRSEVDAARNKIAFSNLPSVFGE